MKKKVCLVTNQYWPEWNGVARSCYRFVSYLIESNYDVHVISATTKIFDEHNHDNPDLFLCAKNPEIDEHGAKLYRLNIPHPDSINSHLADLITLLNYKYEFDIFHGFWLPYTFPALMVAKKYGKPVIGSIRGSDANHSLGRSMRLPFIQSVLQKSDWITSVASDLIVGLNGVCDISNKSSVITNGIDITGFPAWTFDGCIKGAVGTAGQIRFKKGLPILIDAYSEIDKEIRGQLRIIGPYNSVSDMKSAAEQVVHLGVDEECLNLGYLNRKNLLPELIKLNVFVIPSIHDGLPNTLLEAAGCGVPIVASNVGGMADVLEDGVNALLVTPGNPHLLSAAITRVLKDENLANTLSVGAKNLAKNLGHDQEKQSWLSVYRKFDAN